MISKRSGTKSRLRIWQESGSKERRIHSVKGMDISHERQVNLYDKQKRECVCRTSLLMAAEMQDLFNFEIIKKKQLLLSKFFKGEIKKSGLY